MKNFVFVNGYGLVRFKPTKVFRHIDLIQHKGKVRLPKGVYTGEGKKWAKVDYWFSDYQIFESKEVAINSIKNGYSTQDK